MDTGSESRSVVEGGSPTSVIRGSARSLPALLEHTNVALYQVRAVTSPHQFWKAVASLEEANQRQSLASGVPSVGTFLVPLAHGQQLQKRETDTRPPPACFMAVPGSQTVSVTWLWPWPRSPTCSNSEISSP